MIRQLPQDVRSYLRSGVAITSVTQCVEELLLNSLDAGATCVAVRLDLDCFKVQVVDNGTGMAPDQLKIVGNRYSTSKCHSVSDLDNLCHYGYRGEALASIREACGVLEITSRTKHSSNTYCKLFQNGKPLEVTDSVIPRPSVGTTVTVHDLFQNFPVRRKSTNICIELERIRQRVEGLALLKPGVSISVRNDTDGSIILQTHKCSNSLITFTHLFGTAKARSLSEVKKSQGHFSIEGYISKESHAKKDMQFVFINGRLVLKTKIHKLVNHCMQKSSIFKRKSSQGVSTPDLFPQISGTTSPAKWTNRYPVYILDIKCPLTEYDITFDPAKTLVEFKDWETVLDCTTELVNEFIKNEKLVFTPDVNDRNPIPTQKSKSSENQQQSSAISPSNMKDTMFSKRAKRLSKTVTKNTELNSDQTPEKLSLQTWKAANKSVCSNKETDTEFTDLERSDTTLISTSEASDSETNLTENLENDKSFKSTDHDRFSTRLGTKQHSLTEIVDKDKQKANQTSKPIVSNLKFTIDQTPQSISLETWKRQFAKETAKGTDSVQSINEKGDGHQLPTMNQSELGDQPFQQQNITESMETSNACTTESRSSLSKYRKSMGKYQETKEKAISVDKSLSKMTTAGKLTSFYVEKRKNSLSSLQQFKKHKDIDTSRPYLGYSPKVSNRFGLIGQKSGQKSDTLTDREQASSRETYPSLLSCSECKQVRPPTLGGLNSLDIEIKHGHLGDEKQNVRFSRKRTICDYDTTEKVSKLSRLVKQKTATVTIEPELTADSSEYESINWNDHNKCPLLDTVREKSDKFDKQIDMMNKDIESLSRDILGENNDLPEHEHYDQRFDEHSEHQTVDEINRQNEHKKYVATKIQYLEEINVSDHFNVSANGTSENVNCPTQLRDQAEHNQMTRQFSANVSRNMHPEEEIRGSQLFRNLPDEIGSCELSPVSINNKHTTEFVIENKTLVNSAENAYKQSDEMIEYSTQGFSPAFVQSQSGLSDKITDLGLSQATGTPLSEGFSPNLDNMSEGASDSQGFSPNVFVSSEEMKGSNTKTTGLAHSDAFGNGPDSKKNENECDSKIPSFSNKEVLTDTCSKWSTEELSFIHPRETDMKGNIESGKIHLHGTDELKNISCPSTTQLLKPASQFSETATTVSSVQNNNEQVAFWDIFTPTQDTLSSNADFVKDQSAMNDISDNSLTNNMTNQDTDTQFLNDGNRYIGSFDESFSYEKENISLVDNNEMYNNETATVDTDKACDKYETNEAKDIDDTFCDLGSSFESEAQDKTPSLKFPSNYEIISHDMSDDTRQQADIKLGEQNTASVLDKNRKDTDMNKEQLIPAKTDDTCVGVSDPWIQLKDPVTGEDMYVHRTAGITIPASEWKGQQGPQLLQSDQETAVLPTPRMKTDAKLQNILPEKHMTAFKPTGSARVRSAPATNTLPHLTHTDPVPGCSKATKPESSNTILGSSSLIPKLTAPIPGSTNPNQDPNSDTMLGSINSNKNTGSIKSNKNTGSINSNKNTAILGSINSNKNTAILDILEQHLIQDNSDIQVKWRDGHIEGQLSTPTHTVEDMFTAWDNPVFQTIDKEVVNAETRTLPSRSTMKAYQSAHTCTFTKDMLDTVKVVGQLDNKFIVCLMNTDKQVGKGDPDMLAVIDQHAAHERVRLELLTEEAYVDSDVERGQLLAFTVDPPRCMTFTEDEVRVIDAYNEEFQRIGINYSRDGQSRSALLLHTVPACLVVQLGTTENRKKEPFIYWDTIQTLIKEHVELLMATQGIKGRLPQVIHKVLCSLACHGAIKFGDPLSLSECQSLIHDLCLCDLPFQCAHGRPSTVPVLQLQQLHTQATVKKQTKPQLNKLTQAIRDRQSTN